MAQKRAVAKKTAAKKPARKRTARKAVKRSNVEILQQRGLLEKDHDLSEEQKKVLNRLKPEELRVIIRTSKSLGLHGGLGAALKPRPLNY